MSSDSRWPRLIAAALSLLATAAVLITALVLIAWRMDKSGSEPLAPGLAALSDDQLADLLPKRSDFPGAWTVNDTKELRDVFGYFRYHVSDDGLGFNPADPDGVAERKDVRLMVGREFEPIGFDAMVGLVSRCSQFTTAADSAYTVNIIEDSHPPNGPQRFRYSLTSTLSGVTTDATQTEYFSYARQSGLILTGSASAGHQQAFDVISDNTLRRISDRAA